MVKYIVAAVVAMAIAFPVAAAHSNAEYHLSGVTVKRLHGLLKFNMTVNPADYRLKTNQRLEVTPVLRSKTTNDSIVFPSFTVAGRNSYYSAMRDGKSTGELLRSGHGEGFEYTTSADWADWMEYSKLDLVAKSTGCCGALTEPQRELPVAVLDYRPAIYNPIFHYKAPQAETSKMRRIEGKAYVNFPVNRTEIYPDYMVNPIELRKITSSIDTVRLNPDATVKSITLTGFASPEGPYLNNVRLAKGRTEAVKEYVRKQYTFPASVFHTNSVPEDWAGLRDSVATGILPDRSEILDFIDNANVPIERKNDELKKRFPRSYDYLLKHIYPSLRHTNYAIDYELRSFTDVEEIKRVMRERPQNLSLNEFYIAANSYQSGSKEYDEVFELAVMYYPHDDIANMNAANSAMHEGDYRRARMYLNRVSESPEQVYTLALLNAMEKNYDAARNGLEKAKNAGIAEAGTALEELERVVARNNRVTFSEEFIAE